MLGTLLGMKQHTPAPAALHRLNARRRSTLTASGSGHHCNIVEASKTCSGPRNTRLTPCCSLLQLTGQHLTCPPTSGSKYVWDVHRHLMNGLAAEPLPRPEGSQLPCHNKVHHHAPPTAPPLLACAEDAADTTLVHLLWQGSQW